MKDDLPIGMMDQPNDVIARFRRMVANGESPRLAEMLAVRRAPSLDTDTVHFSGMNMSHLAKTVGRTTAEKYMNQARAAGISVNENSFFNGSIADERQGADPDAWRLVGDGKDKFKRVVRERGGASEELGVNFGESQERTDREQTRLTKQRAKNKQFRTMKKQLSADIATGTQPKSIRPKV